MSKFNICIRWIKSLKAHFLISIPLIILMTNGCASLSLPNYVVNDITEYPYFKNNEGLEVIIHLICSTKNGRFMCGVKQPLSHPFALQNKSVRHILKLHDACFCYRIPQYTKRHPDVPRYGWHIPDLEHVQILAC